MLKKLLTFASVSAFISWSCLVMTAHASGKLQSQQAGSGDGIQITTVPPPGGGPGVMDLIAGRVTVENPSRYRVVVYSHTDRWYVQPYVAAPFTDIDAKGRWQTRIHLGYEYAALLVTPEFKPASTTVALPKVGDSVIAIARAAARE